MDALETDPGLRGRPIAAENIRPLVTIPAGTSLHQALAAMQRAGAHLGQLVDEAGTTLGVVAMEDVLEELVGEIRDAAASRRP
jgi:CBS domain containing-hemolysin-like protein